VLSIHLCLQDLANTRVVTGPIAADVVARLAIEAEKEAIARAFVDGGMRAVLSGLHPSIRWVAPVLEIDGIEDSDIDLGGQGVLLMPEFRLSQVVFLGNDLRYPICRSYRKQNFGDPVLPRQLRRLLGRTRAEVLLCIAMRGCPTGTEIGRFLGMSSATVSEQTAVLREAGLIASWRSRNTVRSGLTPLGTALIDASKCLRTFSGKFQVVDSLDLNRRPGVARCEDDRFERQPVESAAVIDRCEK
jgi:DNA-binding MarR family transcriptional regulator